MHALAVKVQIEKGREDEGIRYLHSDVLPATKLTPGLVSGYWLASRDGEGLTVLVFEDEETAQGAAAGLAQAPRVDFATLGDIEVREVVAHL